MSVGDIDHSAYGAYGPGNTFRSQANFRYFWWTHLNLTVSANDTGMLINEGVTFNWLRRQYVFCGGQQVLKPSSVLNIVLKLSELGRICSSFGFLNLQANQQIFFYSLKIKYTVDKKFET